MGFWILIGFISALAAYIWLGRRAAAKKSAPRPVFVPPNPYKAVSVMPGRQACKAARNLAEQRYLASEAPTLPLPGCRSAQCTCHYEYHEDRRDAEHDRRGPHAGLQRNFAESEGFAPRKSNDRRKKQN